MILRISVYTRMCTQSFVCQLGAQEFCKIASICKEDVCVKLEEQN